MLVGLSLLASCASSPSTDAGEVEPPPGIRAWMDRLTVEHAYDPETGFIVAKEVIGLPPVITGGPQLEAALERAGRDGRTVVVFATADRCAPCQQYKRDALNDAGVIERLSRDDVVATHVEVDRQPDVADMYLGGRAIPMTYAFRDGERVGELRGQRSAEELLAWLGAVTQPR